MKVTRTILVIVCLLPLGGAASARTTTIRQKVDYAYNVWDFVTPQGGVWFAEPNVSVDQSPFYRTSDQDWGWTHEVSSLVPREALGIESASVSVVAWDADHASGEYDVIYANGVNLGMLNGGVRLWSTTSFDLPVEVLEELWADGEVYVFMDIDRERDGFRVTLKSSSLTVKYIVPEVSSEPTVPVHRFWSGVIESHFYTADEAEKEKVIANHADVWEYEGPAFYAYPEVWDPNVRPVYRFWSDKLDTHFYTIREGEKDKLIKEYLKVWEFEGPAFYAHPEGLHSPESRPVYRFWSDSLGRHFFTANESEKQKLLEQLADVWVYEGVAWYAYMQ